MKTKLRVSFTHTFDNDDYEFFNKQEAIKIAQMLINVNSGDSCGGFDYVDEGDYKYLLFKEYVFVEVFLDGSPLYELVSDVKPKIKDGEFCSVQKVKE